MYYPSATSRDVIFLSDLSNVFDSPVDSPRDRGIHRQQISLVASAFFLFAFIYVFACIIPIASASNREIAEDYRRQGYEAQQNDQYSKALSFYYKAAAIDSKNASYWNDIGLAYELMEDSDSAQMAYEKSIAIDPNYLAPYANLGHFYQQRQDTVKAIAYFEKRVELGNPADPWTQRARKDLEDLYMSAPLYRERFMNAETKRLNLQASQQTRENFKNQMRIASSEYERGMLLMQEKKPKEALRAFTASLTFAPNNPKTVEARDQAMRMVRAQRISAKVDKAMQFLYSGQERAAKEQFKEILSIFPNQP